jgi:hypothetical protein
MQLVLSFLLDHPRRANHLRAPKTNPPIALSATKSGSGLATTFVEKEMSSSSSSLGTPIAGAGSVILRAYCENGKESIISKLLMLYNIGCMS